MNPTGTVYLIGAGPGDARLLTLRGAELLGRAEVVVCDPLVNPDLLQLASKSAEVLGRRGQSTDPALSPQAMHELLVSRARAGKSVVRLNGGEAYSGGRGGEEACRLAAAGVPLEVVPGVAPAALMADGAKTQPLLGQRVVVTRAPDQARQLAQPLAERGAEVLAVPVIKIVPPSRKEPLVEAIAGLNAYDWIIFTSVNGVTSFFDYFFKAFEDMRDLGGARLAAVGPSTAAQLRQLHLKVDVMPKEYVAAQVANALASYTSIENLRILLLRAEVASPELPKLLEEMGAIVDDIACYKTVPETEDRNGAAARMLEGGADWVTFTSGSTVENFHARFDLPKLRRQFPRLRLATIGPETTKALVAVGLKPAVEAKPPTIAGLVKALERASGKRAT
jgi:uroporphyrinogen III methyltransferase/synthase